MPATQKSPVTRFILTLVLFVIATGFVVSTILLGNRPSSSGTTPPASEQTQEVAASGEETTALPETTPEPTPRETVEAPPEAPQADPGEPSLPERTERLVDTQTPPSRATPGTIAARVQTWAEPSSLGDIVIDGDYRIRVRFTAWGAGIDGVDMANYFIDANAALAVRGGAVDAPHYTFARSSQEFGGVITPALAARGLFLEDGGETKFIDLFSAQNPEPNATPARVPVWRELGPGHFESIVEADGEPMLRLTRRFTLTPGSYEIAVEQLIENLTDRPLTMRLVQYGPSDLDEEFTGYRIDSRRIRFGYITRNDPSRQFIEADGKLFDRSKILKDASELDGAVKQIWPWEETFKTASELSWIGQTNRYFGFVVHPRIDRDAARLNLQNPEQNPVDKALPLVGRAYARVLGTFVSTGYADLEQVSLALELESAPVTVRAGGTLDLSFGVFAGPLSRRVLDSREEPIYRALNLDGLIIYQIGMCGMCTFQWLGQLLFRFLLLLHDYVVFDWALAILVLVLCVRAVIHPITKKSQISMMRFGKQMQRIQPKIKKLQEKYKNDPKTLQQEQIRLMREERVNYAGALGCLPLLLQTPIWIALYAMLYFAFELRHQPAFFGLFQMISGNNWLFLSDLSSPDRFIHWGGNFGIPLVENIMGPITGLNVVPLLMGVVFYFHMKYMTPPSTGNLSPEQEQTQKIMRVMMVVMMPVFMYNAPAGLTLYIATSSLFGILESRYIRAHVDKMDLEAPPPMKKPGLKSVRNEAGKQSRNPFAKKRDAETRERFKKRK